MVYRPSSLSDPNAIAWIKSNHYDSDVSRCFRSPKKELSLETPDLEALCDFLKPPEGYSIEGILFSMMFESGMIDQCGPHYDAEFEALLEAVNWHSDKDCVLSEHEEALELWRAENEPCCWLEYDPHSGCEHWVGSGKVLTAEALMYHEENAGYFEERVDQTVESLLRDWKKIHTYSTFPGVDCEIFTSGEGHAVAMCEKGAVFVPKGSLNWLQSKGVAVKGRMTTEGFGTTFKGEVKYTPQSKYPWRLVDKGIEMVY